MKGAESLPLSVVSEAECMDHWTGSFGSFVKEGSSTLPKS